MTGEVLHIPEHPDEVHMHAWSPDGRRITSSDETGMVRVWDATSGQEVLSFDAPATALSVNWSSAGHAVIVGGFFNTPIVRRAWHSTQ